jgi:hypothetical protein
MLLDPFGNEFDFGCQSMVYEVQVIFPTCPMSAKRANAPILA